MPCPSSAVMFGPSRVGNQQSGVVPVKTRAGKLQLEGGQLHADLRSGVLYFLKTDDGLLHLDGQPGAQALELDVEALGRDVLEQPGGGDRLVAVVEEVADVDGLADDGVAGLGHVDADLVGLAGLKRHGADGGHGAQELDGLDVGHGVLADGTGAGAGRRMAQRAAQAVAAIGWLLTFLPWVLRSTWIYLTPRVDGKPG